MIQSFQLISNIVKYNEVLKLLAEMKQYYTHVETIDWHPFTLIIAGDTHEINYFTNKDKHILFIEYPFRFKHKQAEIDYYLSPNWDLISPYTNHSMFLFYDKKKGEVCIYNPLPGIVPVYIQQNDNKNFIQAGSEIKFWLNNESIPLHLKPYEYFSNTEGYLSTLSTDTVFENISRLHPSNILLVSKKNFSVTETDTSIQISDEYDDKFWIDQLYNTLNKVVEEQFIEKSSPISLSLSGGYDSGTLAALLHKNDIETNAITIGTRNKNEYNEAKLTAKKYEFPLHYGEIQHDDYFNMYFKSVWLNEITQPEIAAGYPGLYQSYLLSSHYSKKIMTGYGADLLLGDIFGIGHQKLDSLLKHILIKASLSGELSPYLSSYLKTQSIPVYLHPDVIMLCRKMPGRLKTKNGIYKYIQKEMIIKYNMIPIELLEIDKSGLHTGAGLPQMFNELTRNISNEVDIKKKFLYHTLKLLFEKMIPFNELSIDKVATQINYEYNRTIKRES